MAVRILIVDDNHDFLAAARRVLDQDGVSVVGTASTIADALRLVANEQPDVSLVDVGLGEESGFDLAQRLAATSPPRPNRTAPHRRSHVARSRASVPAAISSGGQRGGRHSG